MAAGRVLGDIENIDLAIGELLIGIIKILETVQSGQLPHRAEVIQEAVDICVDLASIAFRGIHTVPVSADELIDDLSSIHGLFFVRPSVLLRFCDSEAELEREYRLKAGAYGARVRRSTSVDGWLIGLRCSLSNRCDVERRIWLDYSELY